MDRWLMQDINWNEITRKSRERVDKAIKGSRERVDKAIEETRAGKGIASDWKAVGKYLRGAMGMEEK